MKSNEWKDKRKSFFNSKHFSGYCGLCRRDATPYDIHHLHYRNLGKENFEDLIALCKSYHWKEHKHTPKKKYKKKKKEKFISNPNNKKTINYKLLKGFFSLMKEDVKRCRHGRSHECYECR